MIDYNLLKWYINSNQDKQEEICYERTYFKRRCTDITEKI